MFDDRFKNLRIARGLSQAQVAEALGLPQKTYCNYERNEREPMKRVKKYLNPQKYEICPNFKPLAQPLR